jgi:alkanesulfonate monooxygenase SsuD/methylene tetrahydromethanopterin reductase-like flavin-dependent oxidoreductase (luciferase family)
MAGTVGAIAPGRLTIALGSGDELSREENEAFDLPYWEGSDRTAQLASTVQVLRDHLEGETVTRRDDFVDIRGLPPGPRTAERPALWVAGRTDDALEVAARFADGWNGWGGTLERFTQDASNVVAMAGDRAVELTWAGIARDEAATAELVEGVIGAGARHVILTPPQAAAPGAYDALGRLFSALR